MPTVTAQFILPDMDHFGGCGQSDSHRAGSPGTVGGFGESLLIGKGRSNAESIGNKNEGLSLEKLCWKVDRISNRFTFECSLKPGTIQIAWF
jgi:hypothetical protein